MSRGNTVRTGGGCSQGDLNVAHLLNGTDLSATVNSRLVPGVAQVPCGPHGRSVLLDGTLVPRSKAVSRYHSAWVFLLRAH